MFKKFKLYEAVSIKLVRQIRKRMQHKDMDKLISIFKWSFDTLDLFTSPDLTMRGVVDRQELGRHP